MQVSALLSIIRIITYYTYLATHSCERSCVWKHEYEVKVHKVTLFKFRRQICQGSMETGRRRELNARLYGDQP